MKYTFSRGIILIRLNRLGKVVESMEKMIENSITTNGNAYHRRLFMANKEARKRATSLHHALSSGSCWGCGCDVHKIHFMVDHDVENYGPGKMRFRLVLPIAISNRLPGGQEK